MEKDYKTAASGASVEVTLRSYLDKAGLRQVLDAVGRRVDGAEGLPRFYFAEETSVSGEISPVAEETVVEPDQVVWDSVTEHFYGLSREGVYFRKWPGADRWNDPGLANGNSSYADKLYLNTGAKFGGLYSFAFSSVTPDRVWPPEESEAVSTETCQEVMYELLEEWGIAGQSAMTLKAMAAPAKNEEK